MLSRSPAVLFEIENPVGFSVLSSSQRPEISPGLKLKCSCYICELIAAIEVLSRFLSVRFKMENSY